MLVSLDTRRRGLAPSDAVGMLLDCHTRIRSFTTVALRLCHAMSPPDSEVAEAAAAVHRYFTIALPLHVEDEDLSLAPRLLAVATPDVIDDIAALAVQHRDIEERLDRLVPLWRVLSGAPWRRGRLGEILTRETERLDRMFEQHLQLEEERIFPAARVLLNLHDQAAVAKEIRERRRQSMSAPAANGSIR